MSKIRYILRLYLQGRSKLQISENSGVSRNTLKSYIKRFEELLMSSSELEALSDKELESLMVKPPEQPINARLKELYSLFPEVEKQLKRKGMTRQKLWQKYYNSYEKAFSRSRFNVHFSIWKSTTSPTMHIEHKAGDKMYIDYAGDKLSYIDDSTGEIIYVEVFVAALGASQLTYVEAVHSQQKEDFIKACESGLHYFGGVPLALVPDNLKSAVSKSSKYEPIINETFAEFAEHYGFTVLPARAYKPRDKAIVENTVKIIYTKIYSIVKEKTYHSLMELNEAIHEQLEKLNNNFFKGRDYSRRMQFEEIERKELNELPMLKFEFKKYHYATVAKNGYVNLKEDKHYYSVPFAFIGKKVKLSYTGQIVYIYYNYEQIAIHDRNKSSYRYTTDTYHLASTHKFVSEWNPDTFIMWGNAVHEDVGNYLSKLLADKSHPEQGYKSCMGILSFERRYGKDRLIKACQRGLAYEIYNYKMIQDILIQKLDFHNEKGELDIHMPEHENIRGSKYYN